MSQFSSLLRIESNKKYLDIACGTSNYTSEIAKFGGNLNAFDQSEVMLSEAVPKSNRVNLSKFDVKKTGFQSNYFDGAMCSLAIHHFPDLSNAFKEIARILKPMGKMVLFTATPEQMYSYWLNEYFPCVIQKSCEQIPSLQAISNAIEPHRLKIETTIPFLLSLN